MAFVTPTVRRRILITGETGSGKTHSLRSFPSPKVVLICPGEKGQDTLLKYDGTPLDADTRVIVWENDPSKPITSTAVIEEVRKQLFALVKEPIQTLAIDGFHKLYEYAMDAKSGGEYFAGSPFKTESRNDTQVVDPRVSSQAEHWMTDTLSIALLSRIPYVVVTVWDADKGTRKAKTGPDGKKEKWTDIPTYKMPALYSGASKKLLGEFGISVHATRATWREKKADGSFATITGFRWQTQPDNEVGACQIKGEGERVQAIPKFVNADWRELAKYLE